MSHKLTPEDKSDETDLAYLRSKIYEGLGLTPGTVEVAHSPTGTFTRVIRGLVKGHLLERVDRMLKQYDEFEKATHHRKVLEATSVAAFVQRGGKVVRRVGDEDAELLSSQIAAARRKFPDMHGWKNTNPRAETSYDNHIVVLRPNKVGPAEVLFGRLEVEGSQHGRVFLGPVKNMANFLDTYEKWPEDWWWVFAPSHSDFRPS